MLCVCVCCDFGVVGVDVGCKEEVGYWGVSAGGGVGVLLRKDRAEKGGR